MFGYIVPEKPELKMREYELYRGYYCGICKAIGQKFGQIPRLTLNYDSVFLAMITDGFSEKTPPAKPENCIIHPFQKRLMVRSSPGVEYAAELHVILSHYKLKDDFDDDRSIKGLAGMALLHWAIKKMMKKHPDTCIILQDKLAALTELEKANCPSLDQVSEPFAQLMEAVFCPDISDRETAQMVKKLGYHLGKWIYILDAYDDKEQNRQNGGYNTFLVMEKQETAGPGVKERAEFSLMYHLGEMAALVKKLPLQRNREIIENILYLGMLKKTEEVLGVKGEENATKSI